jgi:hypothetical protein
MLAHWTHHSASCVSHTERSGQRQHVIKAQKRKLGSNPIPTCWVGLRSTYKIIAQT